MNSSIARKHSQHGYTDRGYGRAFSEAELQAKELQISLDIYFRLLDADLPRNALVVAHLLHRQIASRAYALAAGYEWPTAKLPVALFNRCGFTRRDIWRALKQLERKGLIRVHRKPGSRSTVTVLWHPIRELGLAPAEDEEEEEWEQ
jgi:hypothetical protein